MTEIKENLSRRLNPIKMNHFCNIWNKTTLCFGSVDQVLIWQKQKDLWEIFQVWTAEATRVTLTNWSCEHSDTNNWTSSLKHMLSANREESMILSAEHWPSQHQDWAQAKSLVCNYRYLNYVFSLSLAFCIENHCYRKTKSSSLLPVCSLCVSLHSVIISSGGAVQRFARHFTIMSLNRERSLMLC